MTTIHLGLHIPRRCKTCILEYLDSLAPYVMETSVIQTMYVSLQEAGGLFGVIDMSNNP